MAPDVEFVGPSRHHQAEAGRHPDGVVDRGVAIDLLGDGNEGVGRVAVELGRPVDDEDAVVLEVHLAGPAPAPVAGDGRRARRCGAGSRADRAGRECSSSRHTGTR